MATTYIQLKPNGTPPDVSHLRPFRAVVVIDDEVTQKWQSIVSSWLVGSGCLYMMAFGNNCSAWNDSVDYANCAAFNFGEIPDEYFVMTTWHENEPLKNVFWFAKNSATHPTVDLPNLLILHVSDVDEGNELLSECASA
jgi:hypothetical protein